MALTNVEKQRIYRERALKNPDGKNLARLQVLIDPWPNGCLNRMVKATGKTKKELIEMAILDLADKLNCHYGE